MPEINDTDRELDDGLGEQDPPEAPEPADVVPVPTDWEPSTDDEMEDVNA